MSKYLKYSVETDRRGRHTNSAGDDPVHFVLLGGPDDAPVKYADTLNCDYMIDLEDQQAIMERLATCWNEYDHLRDRVAELEAAIAAEREACAKIIEDWPTWDIWRSEGADAIRARSTPSDAERAQAKEGSDDTD